jgi:hypothetical protein
LTVIQAYADMVQVNIRLYCLTSVGRFCLEVIPRHLNRWPVIVSTYVNVAYENEHFYPVVHNLSRMIDDDVPDDARHKTAWRYVVLENVWTLITAGVHPGLMGGKFEVDLLLVGGLESMERRISKITDLAVRRRRPIFISATPCSGKTWLVDHYPDTFADLELHPGMLALKTITDLKARARAANYFMNSFDDHSKIWLSPYRNKSTIEWALPRSHFEANVNQRSKTPEERLMYMSWYEDRVKYAQVMTQSQLMVYCMDLKSNKARANEAFEYLVEPLFSTNDTNIRLQEVQREEPIREIYVNPGFDAYKLTELAISDIGLNTDSYSQNAGPAHVVDAVPLNLVTDVTTLSSEVTMRGGSELVEKSYYAVGMSDGTAFSGFNKWQALKTMVSRLNRDWNFSPITGTKPKDKVTREGETMVKDIVDHWHRHYKQDVFKRITLGEYFDLYGETFLRTVLSDVVEKGYITRFCGEYGSDVPKIVETVRFNLKQTFKPMNTMKVLNFNKAGQGITAWGVCLLLTHILACRMITNYDNFTDRKDDQVYNTTDNGVNNMVFMEELANVFKRFEGRAMEHFVLDLVLADATHDAFTQKIEYEHKRRLGVSEGFMDMHMKLRSYRRIDSGFATLYSEMQNLSGHPWTLDANGVAVKLIGAYMIKHKGPVVFVSKGDDGDKFAACQEIDETIRLELKRHTSLEIVAKKVDVGEFCGMIILDGVLVPNAHRILQKIVAFRALDYKMFAEYQISIRDYQNIFSIVGTHNVIKAVCYLRGCSWSIAEMIVEAVISWGNLSEKQWRREVSSMSEVAYVPYKV